jgi:GNAT superfamily N-acetyltransferase
MQIREATELDIPGILEVLRASLGETSSKKTAEVWRYKHIDNPFGASLVLVAEEDNKLIGVRAFMRWQWQKGEQVYSTFRAVDTATHPDHQGKGVFKKLTLKALELAEKNGDHFVFNTPNAQSKPGYLKMGWKEIGKLKVSLKPFLNLGSKKFEYEQTIKDGGLDDDVLDNLYLKQQKEEKLFTPKNAKYLEWRYKNCKLQDYMIYEDKDIFVAAYLKKRGRFNELRVSEAIALNNENKKKANRKINDYAKKVGAQVVTAAPGTLTWGIKGSFGPVLTQKNLGLTNEELNNFQDLDSWNYELGDLELF